MLRCSLSKRDHRPRRPVGRPWSAAAVLLTLALAPVAAQGLGLGRLSGEAVLGEPLQLTIPLTGVAGAPLDNECVILGRPREPIDADYFPRDLRSRIERRDGASHLVLSSASVLRQPLVEFRVAIHCGYNLAHDYLLMASPRQATAAPQGPRRPPEAAALPAPAAPATGLPDSRTMPDGVPARMFLVERSLTLAELARLHFPGPLRRERFARWVVEANPELFAGVRDVLGHRLQPGQQVLVPAGVPPRRPGDHQAPRPAAGDVAAVPPVAARAGRAAPVDKAGRAGQGPARDEGRLVIGAAGGTARDLRETLALVDRLAGMLELQVVAQNANDERLRTLEAAVAELTRSLTQVETSARQDEARRQEELTALRRNLAGRSDPGWLTLIAAILGGGLAGAGLLHLLRRLAGRGGATPVGAEVPLAPLDVPREPLPAAEERPLPPAAPAAPAAPLPPRAPVAPARPMPAAAGRPSPAVQARPPSVQIDFEPPVPARPGPTTRPLVDLQPGVSDPAAEAIELANVMVSMGLANSAAQALVQHIQDNPRQSLFQWLKLLELHRATGNRDQFEASAQEMSQHFNVQPAQWSGEAAAGRQSLEAYPHLRARLLATWGTPDGADFLQRLLLDNREGTRVGFPLLVAEEILLLLAIHDVRR